MVFLPECFDYVDETTQQAVSQAEPIDGPMIARYKALAKDLGLWISLGGFHEKVMCCYVINLLVPGVGYIRLESKPPSCRESDISDWDFRDSPCEPAVV